MNPKTLIICIILSVLGVGGFFVYQNISAPEIGEKAPASTEETRGEEEIPQEEGDEPIILPEEETREEEDEKESEGESLSVSSYHIENPPYYREDGFCWGASAIMLMMNRGLKEIENVRTIMKSGPGGTPDMFMGFSEFGVIDKARIAYSRDYIKEFADFYNQQILVRPEEQRILLENQADALSRLKELISSDILVIADVHYGNHFVVVTGYDEDYIYINDPGYDNGYEYSEGPYQEHAKLSVSQFLKEWGISQQEKTLIEKEGAIGFPGDYGMIWLKKN